MEEDSMMNRKPAVAGAFYPPNREELDRFLAGLYSDAVERNTVSDVLALITPHAGYEYSGVVAASAFNQLNPNHHYDNVFIIGTSHYGLLEGASIYCSGNFITPLGLARVNADLSKKLIRENPGIFTDDPELHLKEHSIEVQIPFLQYLYKDDLQIVPIITGAQKQATIQKIAGALKPYWGKNNLFVISTDFSHYPNYDNAIAIDKSTLNAILSNSTNGFNQILHVSEDQNIPNLATRICGWSSVLVLLNVTEELQNVVYNPILYMNSGDRSGASKSRVVGYHALTVTSQSEKSDTSDFFLNREDKKDLLELARTSIDSYIKTKKLLSPDTLKLSPKLKTAAGAFVSIYKNGELRGCIGNLRSPEALYQVVQDVAISAATRDYRFKRIDSEEMPEIEIEISVLTPMKKIESISEIIPGRHGIYIRKGSKSGTFLPQVAAKTGWNTEELLGHCARDKAGIGWEGWKDADIYIYEALVFSEKDTIKE